MGTSDLPDMYALSAQACGPWALSIHIRQITHAMLQLLHTYKIIEKNPCKFYTEVTGSYLVHEIYYEQVFLSRNFDGC